MTDRLDSLQAGEARPDVDLPDAMATDTPVDAPIDAGTQLAIPLGGAPEPAASIDDHLVVDEQVALVEREVTARVLEPSRALVPSDLAAPALGAGDRFLRFAYRMGIPGHTLASPLKRPGKQLLSAVVESPLTGDRASGVALRAGHFLVHGVKAPIAQMDFSSQSARLTPPFQRVVHGFAWMRDLAGACPRKQAAPVASRITARWLDANPKPGKAAAWEHTTWTDPPVVHHGPESLLPPRAILELRWRRVCWLGCVATGGAPCAGFSLGEAERSSRVPRRTLPDPDSICFVCL